MFAAVLFVFIISSPASAKHWDEMREAGWEEEAEHRYRPMVFRIEPEDDSEPDSGPKPKNATTEEGTQQTGSGGNKTETAEFEVAPLPAEKAPHTENSGFVLLNVINSVLGNE